MPVKKPVTLNFTTTTSVIFPLFGQRREQPARFLQLLASRSFNVKVSTGLKKDDGPSNTSNNRMNF